MTLLTLIGVLLVVVGTICLCSGRAGKFTFSFKIPGGHEIKTNAPGAVLITLGLAALGPASVGAPASRSNNWLDVRDVPFVPGNALDPNDYIPDLFRMRVEQIRRIEEMGR